MSALLLVVSASISIANYSPTVGPVRLSEPLSIVLEQLGSGERRNHCFGDAADHDCDFELVYSDSRNLLIVTAGHGWVFGVTLLKGAAKRYNFQMNIRKAMDFGTWKWEGGKVFPDNPPLHVPNWTLKISADGSDYLYRRAQFGVWITKDRFQLAQE